MQTVKALPEIYDSKKMRNKNSPIAAENSEPCQGLTAAWEQRNDPLLVDS